MIRFLTFPLLMPSVAMAHAGHLGELAGHAHWIGLAAIAAAGVIAAIKLGKKTDTTEEPEDNQETGDDQEQPA